MPAKMSIGPLIGGVIAEDAKSTKVYRGDKA